MTLSASSTNSNPTPSRSRFREPESRWERATDTALDISQTAFATVKEIASLVPLPYLGEAAGLALGLVEIIDKMKDSKEGFEELTSHAFEVIYAVHCTLQRFGLDQPVESAFWMHENVEFLQDTVAAIKKYADSKVNESFSRRIFHLHRNHSELSKYEKRLDRALSLFNVVANIEILENTRRLRLSQHDIPPSEGLTRPRPDSTHFESIPESEPEETPRHSSSASHSPNFSPPSEHPRRPSLTPHQPAAAFSILDKTAGVNFGPGATISINHVNGNQHNDSSYSSVVTTNSNNTFHNNVVNSGNQAYYYWQQQQTQLPHYHWHWEQPSSAYYGHWQPQNIYCPPAL
ncbi:hypothetical protein V5O48_005468 [Marasmius crinis-equi]|uniref:Fungal N-terminal domain-containing protein n=1 Tax=Marasmius crinis-equi TaxID=585013 RepID=A0ABR3FMP1_9AGAR